jgi:hypothetical protein
MRGRRACFGSGKARGVGSIQAPGDVSDEVQKLLSDFCNVVCKVATTRDLTRLVMRKWAYECNLKNRYIAFWVFIEHAP